MAKKNKKWTKDDVVSKKPFSLLGSKKANGKERKSGVEVKFKDGSSRVLLNPSGKAEKFAFELGTNSKITNKGNFKVDDKGAEISLTEKERAYRSGYLDARKDSSRAYKANKK